ncbi:MAG: SDR family NAD(P)-dependent oxidoreductase, partial [Thermaerobacter sp.]|nr:SDR family NAD(P)-dependent oxidoreductase [Thermaerobacter sp.]
MDRLTGQVALITGAGSGMGRAVSQMFVQEGAAVVLVDNQAEPLAETVGRIEEAGGQVESAVCDVSDENSVNRAVAAGIRRFGKLTVIYNNAGIMPEQDHSVLDTDPEVWDW